MNIRELPMLLGTLGYMAASPALIRESVQACGFHNKVTFLFEDTLVVLDKFRQADGFLKSEHAEIQSVFDRFAAEDESTLDSVGLENAIRWMGYPLTCEQVQDLLSEFDIDETGDVNYSEFSKMLRKNREQEINEIRRVLQKTDSDSNGILSTSELRMTMLALGYSPSHEELEDWQLDADGKQREVGLWEVVRAVEDYRCTARDRLRKNEGFTDAEVRKKRALFNRWDKGNAGFIQNQQLAILIQELFPHITHSKDEHTRVKQLLLDIDKDADGKVDFTKFLRLMRAVHDQEHEGFLEREREVLEVAKFPRHDVAEFRKIFHLFCGDKSSEMSFEEFTQMLGTVMQLKTDAIQELHNVLVEEDEDGSMSLDFPEFLMVIWKLQEGDWGGINEALGRGKSVDALQKAPLRECE